MTLAERKGLEKHEREELVAAQAMEEARKAVRAAQSAAIKAKRDYRIAQEALSRYKRQIAREPAAAILIRLPKK